MDWWTIRLLGSGLIFKACIKLFLEAFWTGVRLPSAPQNELTGISGQFKSSLNKQIEFECRKKRKISTNDFWEVSAYETWFIRWSTERPIKLFFLCITLNQLRMLSNDEHHRHTQEVRKWPGGYRTEKKNTRRVSNLALPTELWEWLPPINDAPCGAAVKHGVAFLKSIRTALSEVIVPANYGNNKQTIHKVSRIFTGHGGN